MGFKYSDMIMESGQMVSATHPRWSRSDDGNLFFFSSRNLLNLSRSLGGEVSDESLQGMDGNRFIKLSAIALRFAGMKTDPTTDPGKRVFLLDQTPGPFNIALIYLLDEGNDIVPCWTGYIAGRCLILIKRLLGPPCTCLVPVHMPTGNGNLGHLRGTLESNLLCHFNSPIESLIKMM
jgi:hypothetical protein